MKFEINSEEEAKQTLKDVIADTELTMRLRNYENKVDLLRNIKTSISELIEYYK